MPLAPESGRRHKNEFLLPDHVTRTKRQGYMMGEVVVAKKHSKAKDIPFPWIQSHPALKTIKPTECAN